jgi:glycosyltransferase involved in cell wall biosynthesis
MARSLRILNLIRSLDPVHGGPAEGLRHGVAATRRLGHLEEVLTLDAPGAPWLQGFPAPTHALGPARGTFGYTPRLLPWLRQHAWGYDAVVVHGLWQYHGLAARRALVGGPVPYFVYTHGMLDPWFKREYPVKHAKKWLYWMAAEQAVLRDAAAVLFTTQQESLLAPQTFRHYHAHHQVVGYGLALDPTARAAQAQDFLALHPALQGKRIVLFLARLHAKKGCDLLIEAFAAVAAQDPRLQLVMAGPDSHGLQAPLQQLAQRLGIGDRVTWTGMLGGQAKWGALRAAEVFVLPSHQENFGIAVAEALAVGLPTLLSQQVNIWREVVDGGAGLAADDTVAGTRQLLQQWLDLTPAQQAVMRAATVTCFVRHFHVDAAAVRLETLLHQHAKPALRANPVGIRTGPDSQACNTARPK